MTAFLFPGPAGVLGAAAVKVALAADVSGNAALLFGRMVSYNGKPFWELRCHLAALFGVSKRTITRYFRALVDAELIVNKPAPLNTVPPGCKKALPYRPWYKWAVGLPQLREAVKSGSREAYERWSVAFHVARKERATRSKLGAIIGSIVATRTSSTVSSRATPSHASEPQRPRRWTADELDAKLRESATSSSRDDEPHGPDTS